MKAIIVDRRDGYAAALREDGAVLRLRQAGEIGQEIELNGEILRFPAGRRRWLRSAVAAVAAIMILGGSSTYVFALPAAYVSLDAGNSSVELAVNRVGRVISVRPVSRGDSALAETLDAELRGKPVEDAMRQTVTLFREQGYLDGQDATVIAGVTAESQQRGAELAAAIEQAATGNGGVPLYTLDVTPEERIEAKDLERSGGRYVFERDSEVPEPQAEVPETPQPSGERTGNAVPPQTDGDSPFNGGTPGATELLPDSAEQLPPQMRNDVPQTASPQSDGTEHTPPGTEGPAPTAASEPDDRTGAEPPARVDAPTGDVLPAGPAGNPAETGPAPAPAPQQTAQRGGFGEGAGQPQFGAPGQDSPAGLGESAEQRQSAAPGQDSAVGHSEGAGQPQSGAPGQDSSAGLGEGAGQPQSVAPGQDSAVGHSEGAGQPQSVAQGQDSPAGPQPGTGMQAVDPGAAQNGQGGRGSGGGDPGRSGPFRPESPPG